ncbi:hypothetical protein [Cyclobacterium plantarum]|uniref:Uncharacterized protein n=1 Tax=Cyclobacterium plantarum TaxID=2716263 RepID=A0ABX0H2T3_9BACT|nr:hypothetical protein [Cyclobacterium plantarum]NHE55929.1 hypothetical protein [Cyclobacterium plantarum]
MNKTILTILTSIILLPVFGQEIVRQDGYYDLKFGIYETKSLDKELIGFKPRVIEPQTEFKKEDNSAFLKVKGKVIALFDRVNDKGTAKPIGVLTKTSVIQVDTIFYKEIFKDTTKEWSLTFNVWYAITMNGQQYYTDYKIHDFIALQKELPKYNQEFLLVSQRTGYDEYYDNGYPNHFFVVILNDKNEITYNSEILDFDYGDEFWDAELMGSVSTEMTENGFEFNLSGLEDNFNGIWTGKELKKK